MKEQRLTREIAEQYLDEMLEAERKLDYAAWCRRWRDWIFKDYPEDQFKQDAKECLEDLGRYQSRDYLGCVTANESPDELQKKFVWRAHWEKEQSVIVVGIYEFEGVAYLCEEMFHYGDNNMLMLLLNASQNLPHKVESPRLLSKAIAEQYLHEMDEAERHKEYKSWMRRWKYQDDDKFTETDLLNSMKCTHENLGSLQSREYIGCINGKGDNGKTEYRYAWRSNYERAQAVTTIGICEYKGAVCLKENRIAYGKNSLHKLLLDANINQ